MARATPAAVALIACSIQWMVIGVIGLDTGRIAETHCALADCKPALSDISAAACQDVTRLTAGASSKELDELTAGSNDFIGIGMAYLGAARAPHCQAELQKEPSELRCAQTMYKVAIQQFWSGEREDLAKSAWEEATRPINGSQRILWPSSDETPSIWLPAFQVGKEEVLPCGDAPVDLEILKEEMQQVDLSKAFPYLRPLGVWEVTNLYRGNRWNETACEAMPRTCASLQTWFPAASKDDLLDRYQEAIVFRTRPGTVVPPHSGAVNGMVNLHWTVGGGGSAVMRVGQSAEVQLQDGRGVCFLDAVRHEILHAGEDMRWSLVIRTPHPELICHSAAASPFRPLGSEGVCARVG